MGFALAFIVSPGHPHAGALAAPKLGTQEQAFVALINGYRQENGLQPLTVDWELQSSSDWMSNDTGVKSYFSHTDSLGRNPWTRMCAFDYCYDTSVGENLAAGYRTASEVFTAWKNSPDHNANMLGSNYITMGISLVHVSDSPYGWYWTNDFGGVRSDASAPTGSGSADAAFANTPLPEAARIAHDEETS